MFTYRTKRKVKIECRRAQTPNQIFVRKLKFRRLPNLTFNWRSQISEKETAHFVRFPLSLQGDRVAFPLVLVAPFLQKNELSHSVAQVFPFALFRKENNNEKPSI